MKYAISAGRNRADWPNFVTVLALVVGVLPTDIGRARRVREFTMRAESATSVLFVEDDPLVRLFVIETLVGEGYRAVPAESADEARRLLERGGYDVLMTDIGLSRGQDGFALAAWAARRRPGLRIIYTSGVRDDPGGRMVAPGGFLEKPFGITGLLRSLAAATVGAC
jgi:DNA-binding NtrC family response regulator